MRRRAVLDVFGYRDYRRFLAAYYARRKEEKAGFSFARFSDEIGLPSPNYLKLVVDGERNLKPDLARRFGEGCGLRDEALAYFVALVAFNQAGSAREREQRYAELQAFPRFRQAHRLDAAQSAYHAHWFIPAHYELCAREDLDQDPKSLARALLPPITPRQAAHALSVLQALGLLTHERGRLRQVHSAVETGGGPLGHQIVQFHRAMMERAAEALDHVPRDEREIASLTLCIGEARMRELKGELEAFRELLLKRYMGDASPERVVQVNFQMFPLSSKRSSS
jgi:uncharacterized protein (TIGR02147 family)